MEKGDQVIVHVCEWMYLLATYLMNYWVDFDETFRANSAKSLTMHLCQEMQDLLLKKY